FTQIQPWLKPRDVELPSGLTVGQNIQLKKISLTTGLTSPPEYLTESDLITLMEKNGIGTDSSIPTHVNSVIQRNYVEVRGNARHMIPTQLGIMLVHGYHRIDPDLVLPSVRRQIETLITLVAEGKASKEDILAHSIANFKTKFMYFQLNINFMDELFQSSFTKLEDSGKPFTQCGQCKRFMNLIQTRTTRLYCSTCDLICKLPDGAAPFIERPQQICPLDGFKLVECNFKQQIPSQQQQQSGSGSDSNQTQNNNKTFCICPYCYNFPPEGLKLNPRGSLGERGMRCQRCPNQQCQYGREMNMIGPCFREGECNGVLVLDSTSHPNWRMNCTECQLQVTFNKELVASVQVKWNGICNVCEQMKQIVVQLRKKIELPQKKKEQPLHPNPNTQTEQQQEQEQIPSTTISEDGTLITGCLDCSEEIHNICHINESESLQYNNRFGRGQFRGRRSFRGRGHIGGQRGRGSFRGRGRSRGRRGRGGNRNRNEDTSGYEFVGGKKIFNPFA
ncbi:MAG: putative DNA topoisomerase 3-beta-1, partial [Streblomastix strix]